MGSLALLSATSVVMGGRPLNVNDTEPVATGMWQVEASVGYRHDIKCSHGEYPLTLAYGVCPGLDLGVGLGGQFEERTESYGTTCHEAGFGDITLYPRWKFFDQSRFLPSQAASFTVKLPTADDDRSLGSGATDYDLTWIASRKVGENFQIDANVGYSWIGKAQDEEAADIFHYGLAVEYQVLEHLQWVGEVFAQQEMTCGAETMVQFNTGVRWAARDGLTFDIAAGSRLSGEAPDFSCTLGLTWVFGVRNATNNKNK